MRLPGAAHWPGVQLYQFWRTCAAYSSSVCTRAPGTAARGALATAYSTSVMTRPVMTAVIARSPVVRILREQQGLAGLAVGLGLAPHIDAATVGAALPALRCQGRV